MIEIQKPKQYDLEEKTLNFAKDITDYVNRLPRTIPNIENSKQLVRAGGSVGADYDYIEANESLSRKDFVMRIKISRKEVKESRYWLELTKPRIEYLTEKEKLIKEATELMKIFGSIVEKSK